MFFASTHFAFAASRPMQRYRSAAGRVGGVQKEDRTTLDPAAARDRFGHRNTFDQEFVPAVPILAGETLGRGPREPGIAVGDDEHARAHLRDVDVGTDIEGRY